MRRPGRPTAGPSQGERPFELRAFAHRDRVAALLLEVARDVLVDVVEQALDRRRPERLGLLDGGPDLGVHLLDPALLLALAQQLLRDQVGAQAPDRVALLPLRDEPGVAGARRVVARRATHP